MTLLFILVRKSDPLYIYLSESYSFIFVDDSASIRKSGYTWKDVIIDMPGLDFFPTMIFYSF